MARAIAMTSAKCSEGPFSVGPPKRLASPARAQLLNESDRIVAGVAPKHEIEGE